MASRIFKLKKEAITGGRRKWPAKIFIIYTYLILLE
jgi:hypothetical protein